MANNKKTFQRYSTIVQISEIDKGKYMLNGIINKAQLQSLYRMFEPSSREWRGQYQALAKSIVEAYENLESKKFILSEVK